MSEQTIKCPICGRPYVFYSHYCGDQSACGACKNEARGQKKVAISTKGTTGE